MQEERREIQKKFTVIIERDEDGYYVASVPDLHGCHTQAKNLDTLVKRVRDAIELCLEVEGSGIEPLAAGRTYREASRIP